MGYPPMRCSLCESRPTPRSMAMSTRGGSGRAHGCCVVWCAMFDVRCVRSFTRDEKGVRRKIYWRLADLLHPRAERRLYDVNFIFIFYWVRRFCINSFSWDVNQNGLPGLKLISRRTDPSPPIVTFFLEGSQIVCQQHAQMEAIPPGL